MPLTVSFQNLHILNRVISSFREQRLIVFDTDMVGWERCQLPQDVVSLQLFCCATSFQVTKFKIYSIHSLIL